MTSLRPRSGPRPGMRSVSGTSGPPRTPGPVTRANCRAAVDGRDDQCPSTMHRSMEQQAEPKSSFSAAISESGVVAMLRLVPLALSRGCTFSLRSAPSNVEHRGDERDSASNQCVGQQVCRQRQDLPAAPRLRLALLQCYRGAPQQVLSASPRPVEADLIRLHLW